MSAPNGAPWLRRALQVLFVAAVLWFGAHLLVGQWAEVSVLRASLRPDWWRVAGSCGIVLVSYMVLIGTWRATVAAWGERLEFGTAARIWFVSNLGRYIPGKVWQIGAMGMMANAEGVSAVAAVGSALVVSLVNVLIGFAVVAATGSALFGTLLPSAGVLPAVVALLAIGVCSLPWLLPPLMRLTARIMGRTLAAPRLPARAIWIAALGCGIGWVLYGLAFRELSVALFGAASGDVTAYVAVFTLSYLIGFIVLWAPGGIGVREVSMLSLLVTAGLATEPEATLLVIASRLWLTVLEIAPGVLLLAWPKNRPRSRPADDSAVARKPDPIAS